MTRSKRYKSIEVKKDPQELEAALDLIKKNASAKFTESVEAHINLSLDKKAGQTLRGNVVFPKSFGKKLRIWAFVSDENIVASKKAGALEAGSEDLVDKIEKSKKADFDLAIAEPSQMRFIAKIAKILGPKGLMPSPKNGTVTDKPIETIKEFLAGKTSFRADDTGVAHQLIGRVDFATKDLVANFTALLEEVKKGKPEGHKGELVNSVYLSSTMGKSVAVKV